MSAHLGAETFLDHELLVDASAPSAPSRPHTPYPYGVGSEFSPVSGGNNVVGPRHAYIPPRLTNRYPSRYSPYHSRSPKDSQSLRSTETGVFVDTLPHASKESGRSGSEHPFWSDSLPVQLDSSWTDPFPFESASSLGHSPRSVRQDFIAPPRSSHSTPYNPVSPVYDPIPPVQSDNTAALESRPDIPAAAASASLQRPPDDARALPPSFHPSHESNPRAELSATRTRDDGGNRVRFEDTETSHFHPRESVPTLLLGSAKHFKNLSAWQEELQCRSQTCELRVGHMPRYLGLADDFPVVVLPNPAMRCSLITAYTADRIGLIKRNAVACAQGLLVHVPVELHGLKENIHAMVVEDTVAGGSFDLMLGFDWIYEHAGSPDFRGARFFFEDALTGKQYELDEI